MMTAERTARKRAHYAQTSSVKAALSRPTAKIISLIVK
jgi:hypothetical protein